MKTYFCEIHNSNIIFYENNEEENFVDNDEATPAIFINEKGTKYLKRSVNGKCDFDCPTIQNILKIK